MEEVMIVPRSDHTGSDRIEFERLDSLSRYDLVLAFIPAVFLMSAVLSFVFDIPFRTTLTGASAVGALALLDALFVNPPIRPAQ